MTNPNHENLGEVRHDDGTTVRESTTVIGGYAIKILTLRFASPEDAQLYLSIKRQEYIDGAFEDYPTMPMDVRSQVAETMGAAFDRSLGRSVY